MAESQLVHHLVLRSPNQPNKKWKISQILLQVRLSGTILIARLMGSRRTALELSVSLKF